jgi:lipopolysaccharide/colanic/teichoic acid biosynthesis glycosyltransferase
MSKQKRIFDLCLAIMLVCVLAAPILMLVILLRCWNEGPILYVSERMRTPTEGFKLLKFRTMSNCTQNTGVSGGDKENRITPMGQFLRKTRLDEVPQLWNVLRGDISFVGPRPPLREYVERFPHVYGKVLESRPGITGLATVRFHAQEERLLKGCKTARQTDAVYVAYCIPRKADLDLMYQDKQTFQFDMKILLETAFPMLRGNDDELLRALN